MLHESISIEDQIESTYKCLCEVYSFYKSDDRFPKLRMPDFSNLENFKTWYEEKYVPVSSSVRSFCSSKTVLEYELCDVSMKSVMRVDEFIFEEAVKLFTVWKVTNC